MRYEQLNWYGHLRKMNEERLRRKIMEYFPKKEEKTQKKNKGILRSLQMEEVTTEMRDKGINSMEWINRKEWERKLNLNFRHRKL